MPQVSHLPSDLVRRQHTTFTMQFSLLVLAACSLATSARALPFLSARQTTTDPCAGLGSSALATLPSGFSLAALNTSLPNANSTGAPLVLGYGGAIVGASFNVLSVRPSLIPAPCKEVIEP